MIGAENGFRTPDYRGGRFTHTLRSIPANSMSMATKGGSVTWKGLVKLSLQKDMYVFISDYLFLIGSQQSSKY